MKPSSAFKGLETQIKDIELVTTADAHAPTDRIDSRFGSGFAQKLAGLPVGEWAGPVPSDHGLHLIRVGRRERGEPATLDQARTAVEREWRAERRVEANEAFYRELRERYDVVIEGSVETDNAVTSGAAGIR